MDNTEETASKIQWHPGFCGAFEREFRKYREYLRFDREVPLTKGPLFVDLLIIEMLTPVSMENELGKIFRAHNICEYKGPDDALNIDDYYKTLAYACLYKSSGRTVNAIPAREITISLIRDAYPRKLIQTLQTEGFALSESYPGVFYVERPDSANRQFPFPTQIIVTSQLKRETHSGLRVLRKKADGEDVLRFLTEAKQETEPGDVANVNAILSVSMAANTDLYEKVRRETDMLYPALRELMKEDLDERWEAGLAYGREEGIAYGREEGIAYGREEGTILGAVDIYREEMGLDDDAITDKIAARFHLTKEQAAHYVHPDK